MEMLNNGTSTPDYKLGFNGHLIITKDVPGPIELIIESNRCDLKMKACERYDLFSIGGMCEKFKSKNTFFAGTLSKINPPIVCPVKTGNYTFDNAEFDLNIVSRLPMDGW